MSNIKDFKVKNGVLTKYTGHGGDVVIPDSVLKIGDSAFYGCSSLPLLAAMLKLTPKNITFPLWRNKQENTYGT